MGVIEGGYFNHFEYLVRFSRLLKMDVVCFQAHVFSRLWPNYKHTHIILHT